MPRSVSSILKPKPVTTTLSVRIAESTVVDLRALEARVEQEAAHLKFDVGDVIEGALREAIESATAELDRLKESRVS